MFEIYNDVIFKAGASPNPRRQKYIDLDARISQAKNRLATLLENADHLADERNEPAPEFLLRESLAHASHCGHLIGFNN